MSREQARIGERTVSSPKDHKAKTARTKTWSQKHASAKPAHVVVLEKPFAGIPAGAALFIPAPAVVEKHVRDIPPGHTAELPKLREAMARHAGAMATCPVTSSIHLRIVAETALEALAAGASLADVAPFWRVVDPKGPLAAKLSCGPDFIVVQREIEAVRKPA